MFTHLSPDSRGIVLALLSFSIFALGDAAIKYLSTYYHTFALTFYLGVMVVLMVFAVAPFRGGVKRLVILPDRKWHIVRAACLTLQFILTVYAFSVMPLAKVYALLFAAPLLTAILAWPILKERVSPVQGGLILAGFTGVLLILRPGVIPLDAASVGMLVAAASFAMANIVIRFMKDANQPALAWPLYSEIMIALVSLPFFIADPVIPTLPHMALLTVLAASALVALMLLGMAFRIGSTTVVAPFHYVQMLWAIGLGYIIFGDVIDVWMAAGAALIIASGLLLLRVTSRKVPIV